MGQCIIEENAYSEEAGPDLSWLRRSPSISSQLLLSRPSCPASRINNVTAQAATIHAPHTSLTNMSFRPDPEGIEPPNTPIFFSMGGPASVGHFSPLTTSDIHSLQGGSSPQSYKQSLATHQHPSSGASVVSSIVGFTLPTFTDSSAPTPQAPPMPPVVPSPAIPIQASATTPIAPPITIKDKLSDMGIKPITDKDSWTDAKKFINARLRRAPYWPGESKELVTTNANAAASVWWEEVIVYYCQPPVSNLSVEEHCFDSKGFEMIAHINQHINPSGAVELLGYILHF
jgi:hypothetical protein